MDMSDNIDIITWAIIRTRFLNTRFVGSLSECPSTRLRVACMATFETEIAKNGAPLGVMKGTTAIARGEYGRGRVVCFSPHPELTRGLESLVQDAITHVKRNRPVDTRPVPVAPSQ